MNLQEKLLEIRKSVEYIQKTEKGNQGAMYVDPAVLLKTIRDKMNTLKLLLVPSIKESKIECIDFPTSKNPSAKDYIFSGDMTFTWIDTEDKDADSQLEVPWYLTGKHMQDPAMAFGSALTYTERYFLLKFFQIPTAKDDPEFFEKKTKKIKKLGTANITWLTWFCKNMEIKTDQEKTDLQSNYGFTVKGTSDEEFIPIKTRMLDDHPESSEWK